MYKKCALMLFSTAGALALGATAAMAGWSSYGSTNPITSNWECGMTKPVTTDGSVVSQVCTVRTANKEYFQGAVIVRNNKTSLFNTNAGLAVFYYSSGNLYGSWGCSSSGVAAKSWSVCFGPTFSAGSASYYTGGYANNVPLPYSPVN